MKRNEFSRWFVFRRTIWQQNNTSEDEGGGDVKALISKVRACYCGCFRGFRFSSFDMTANRKITIKNLRLFIVPANFTLNFFSSFLPSYLPYPSYSLSPFPFLHFFFFIFLHVRSPFETTCAGRKRKRIRRCWYSNDNHQPLIKHAISIMTLSREDNN